MSLLEGGFDITVGLISELPPLPSLQSVLLQAFYIRMATGRSSLSKSMECFAG